MIDFADELTHPSPNFGPRRHGGPPSMVVLHYTGMPNAIEAMERLRDRATEVSCHYLIAEDGTLFSLVPETMRAWHAGRGSWGGHTDINSHSIGIELANQGPDDVFPPFPEPQMARLEDLLRTILQRWNIHPARVIGHSDMAPGRKIDPGPAFDWKRLARSGLSVWFDETDPERNSAQATTSPDHVDRDRWRAFQQAAGRFGYVAPRDDEVRWRQILAAFRIRFRPQVWRVDGQEPDCPSDRDVAVVANLARNFPAKFD